jgi:hypothetical protein
VILGSSESGNRLSYDEHASAITATLIITRAYPDDLATSATTSTSGVVRSAGEIDRFENIQILAGTPFADELSAVLNAPIEPPSSMSAFGPYVIQLLGDDGNDHITLSGEPIAGDDRLEHKVFRPVLMGGNGNDTFDIIGYSKLTIAGEAGNDTINFGHNDTSYDSIEGNDGTDILHDRDGNPDVVLD